MKGYNIKNEDEEKYIKLAYNEDYKRCYIPWGPRVMKPNHRFIWALERTAGKNILDYGCGDGVFLSLCAGNKLKPSGYDISTEALSIAKAQLQNKAVLYDSLKDIQDEYFDNVSCFELLEHVDNPHEIMVELFKKCKDGGRVLITIPIENRIPDVMHKQRFDYYNLFELISRFTYDFNIYFLNKFKKTGKKINIFGIIAIKHKKYKYNQNKTTEENLRNRKLDKIFKILVRQKDK